MVLFFFNACTPLVSSNHRRIMESKEEAQKTIINHIEEQEIDNTISVEIGNQEFNLELEWTLDAVLELDLEELAYLRNSIYARHGYVFVSPKYTKYYSKYPWYKENHNFKESDLSLIDVKNIKLVQLLEKGVENLYKNSDDTGITYENLKVETIDVDYTSSSNNPKKVIISDNKNKVFYDSPWNDGLHTSIVDLDKTDDFVDIFIVESGTDISSKTTIYRYDGKSIVKYGSFYQFGGEFIYDQLGHIYYWYDEATNSDYNYCYDYRLNTSYLVEDQVLLVRLKDIGHRQITDSQ